MIFGGSSKSGAGHLNLTFSDTERKLYDIPLRGDAFSPATLPASASLLASMFKCSNVPCAQLVLVVTVKFMFSNLAKHD